MRGYTKLIDHYSKVWSFLLVGRAPVSEGYRFNAFGFRPVAGTDDSINAYVLRDIDGTAFDAPISNELVRALLAAMVLYPYLKGPFNVTNVEGIFRTLLGGTIRERNVGANPGIKVNKNDMDGKRAMITFIEAVIGMAILSNGRYERIRRVIGVFEEAATTTTTTTTTTSSSSSSPSSSSSSAAYVPDIAPTPSYEPPPVTPSASSQVTNAEVIAAVADVPSLRIDEVPVARGGAAAAGGGAAAPPPVVNFIRRALNLVRGAGAGDSTDQIAEAAIAREPQNEATIRASVISMRADAALRSDQEKLWSLSYHIATTKYGRPAVSYETDIFNTTLLLSELLDSYPALVTSRVHTRAGFVLYSQLRFLVWPTATAYLRTRFGQTIARKQRSDLLRIENPGHKNNSILYARNPTVPVRFDLDFFAVLLLAERMIGISKKPRPDQKQAPRRLYETTVSFLNASLRDAKLPTMTFNDAVAQEPEPATGLMDYKLRPSYGYEALAAAPAAVPVAAAAPAAAVLDQAVIDAAVDAALEAQRLRNDAEKARIEDAHRQAMAGANIAVQIAAQRTVDQEAQIRQLLAGQPAQAATQQAIDRALLAATQSQQEKEAIQQELNRVRAESQGLEASNRTLTQRLEEADNSLRAAQETLGALQGQSSEQVQEITNIRDRQLAEQKRLHDEREAYNEQQIQERDQEIARLRQLQVTSKKTTESALAALQQRATLMETEEQQSRETLAVTRATIESQQRELAAVNEELAELKANQPNILALRAHNAKLAQDIKSLEATISASQETMAEGLGVANKGNRENLDKIAQLEEDKKNLIAANKRIEQQKSELAAFDLAHKNALAEIQAKLRQYENPDGTPRNAAKRLTTSLTTQAKRTASGTSTSTTTSTSAPAASASTPTPAAATSTTTAAERPELLSAAEPPAAEGPASPIIPSIPTATILARLEPTPAVPASSTSGAESGAAAAIYKGIRGGSKQYLQVAGNTRKKLITDMFTEEAEAATKDATHKIAKPIVWRPLPEIGTPVSKADCIVATRFAELPAMPDKSEKLFRVNAVMDPEGIFRQATDQLWICNFLLSRAATEDPLYIVSSPTIDKIPVALKAAGLRRSIILFVGTDGANHTRNSLSVLFHQLIEDTSILAGKDLATYTQTQAKQILDYYDFEVNNVKVEFSEKRV